MATLRGASGAHCAAKPSARLQTRIQRQQCAVRCHLQRSTTTTINSTPSAEQAPQASSRRATLLQIAGAAASTALLVRPQPAAAFTPPPQGYRAHLDRLDGYTFVYPEDWAPVTSSGNDIFYRNPYNVEENLFVDISSPSSSKFTGVEQLGSPQDAAQRILDQYLNKEFMSTRLGIKREGEIISAASRTGPDGKQYYDISIRMKSFASRDAYVATQQEVMKSYGLEWDRVLTTTLGVANKRLYELRLQTTADQAGSDRFKRIMASFVCSEVDAA